MTSLELKSFNRQCIILSCADKERGKVQTESVAKQVKKVKRVRGDFPLTTQWEKPKANPIPTTEGTF